MSAAHANNGSTPEVICLACGLCCNGTIFADVKLQPGDDSAKLQSQGLPLSFGRHQAEDSQAPSSTPHFSQPCPAHDGCHCRIYVGRPKYCREFDCRLLQNVREGRVRFGAALEMIRTARTRADQVRVLLRKCGDTDEGAALTVRFRHTTRRLEKLGSDQTLATVYGDLTVAFHELNLLLSEAFYPGES